MVVIEINRHVIGIDIDPQSLELAQENSADLEVCHWFFLFHFNHSFILKGRTLHFINRLLFLPVDCL